MIISQAEMCCISFFGDNKQKVINKPKNLRFISFQVAS